MTKTKTKETNYSGIHLWDEILKGIVSTMPQQLFPLFKEVFGKVYPPGTSIVLLSTEQSTLRETREGPPSSQLMDISLLVGGTDYYHLECQMKNDRDMVIRMISYDLHFAIENADFSTHSPRRRTQTSEEMVLRFPNSIVIYPKKNDQLPDQLRCRLIFPDKSQHIYEIPTVKIQSYSLEEIREKHLSMFLPYTLLRLEPRLKSANPLTKKELTDFVSSLIVILEEEFREGNLTENQLKDYVLLINEAARRLFAHHPEHYQEVLDVTERKIVLYSDLVRAKEELTKALEEKDAVLTEKDAALTEKDAALIEKDAALTKQAAYIAQLEKRLAALEAKTN